MLRVLIADDSLTVRKTVAEKLRERGFDVVGEAVDGNEAVTLTHRLEPDIVLMDVVMPGKDGLEATRQIMANTPTPVVILSAHANRDEVFMTYDALAAGALEVCSKPRSEGYQGELEWQRIFMTIRAAAEVRVMRRHDLRAASPKPHTAAKRVTYSARCKPDVIAIGASTGGPAAIKQVLGALPGHFDIPLIVALHCNPDLATSVAGWFARDCVLPVCDAVDGQSLEQTCGTIIAVPPGYNLSVKDNRTVLCAAAQDRSCSPCIDVLFESLADDRAERALGILLTGMGEDGAAGLKRMRERGALTVVQDEDSCVVFGMPAAAIAAGAAEIVAALDEIASLLPALVAIDTKLETASGILR